MTEKYTPFDWSKNYEWSTWPQLTRSGAGHGSSAPSRYIQDQEENQSFFEGFGPLPRANEARKTVSPVDRKMVSRLYTLYPNFTHREAKRFSQLLNYLHSTIHEVELPQTRVFEPEPRPMLIRPKIFFEWGWLRPLEDGGWEGGPYEFPEDPGDIDIDY
ncbi:uncharacterized protein LAJ45_00526 [Morchella importuna]|uniref:uncharacterized protein n=1 Tax=Morchella importuna TaxID=1174673 RepID=UPI001E8D7FD5|nr:uncharacterized protein LAJ45_00526 [Morchella importuna]KAH8155516.1 hypothetical protein LAJ45_00526 [Morchella importuna]